MPLIGNNEETTQDGSKFGSTVLYYNYWNSIQGTMKRLKNALNRRISELKLKRRQKANTTAFSLEVETIWLLVIRGGKQVL